jgi:alpha-galactosidase
MASPNIVFIGAGSLSFGIPTFMDLFTTPELAGARLWLVDIDPDNLDRMHRLANHLNERSGMGLEIHATGDRREALPGAEYVINSLAIERCDLWKQDFEIPKKHGIRHCLGENGGPGALFFTLRTVPLIIDICRDMEELCPEAWLLNFSNPESRIVLAVNRYTKIKCIGLCHGIFMTRADIARVLGRVPESIEVSAAGLNHIQWILSVRDKDSGKDLYPELDEREREFDPSFRPLTRKIFRAFGRWLTCSDDHLGEHLPYGHEAGTEGYDFEADAKERVKSRKDVEDVLTGRADSSKWLRKSGEKAIEVLVALHTGNSAYIPSAIVHNEGAIENLPHSLAVELPIWVDKGGVHKIHIGKLPIAQAALLSLPAASQQASVEAAIYADKRMALQTLLVDPVIQSTTAAEKLLDELWEINLPYIHPSL